VPQSARTSCCASHLLDSMVLRVAGLSVCIATVAAHGELVWPTSRNAVDSDEVNCPQGDSCNSKVKGGGCVNVTHPGESCLNGQAAFWYSQGCFIGCPTCDHISGRRQTDLCGLGKKASLPEYGRTVNLNSTRFSELDIYQHNPWSAPGSAPVADACGLAAGSPWAWNNAEAGFYVNTTNARHGMTGTQLPERPTGVQWQIGGEATVSWRVRNNHGGGYQYRLCPASEELSEECFQRHPLDFVPEKAGFLFEDGSYELIEPVHVNVGVLPLGSTWARIPVAPTKLGPYCIAGPNDDPNAPNSCAAKNNPITPCGCTPCPQTPGSDCSRCDNCYEQPSYTPYTHNGKPVEGVNPIAGIMDVVKIPGNLPPGKYVLGWRYDCEATAQVWSNCADIELMDSSVPAPVVWPPVLTKVVV